MSKKEILIILLTLVFAAFYYLFVHHSAPPPAKTTPPKPPTVTVPYPLPEVKLTGLRKIIIDNAAGNTVVRGHSSPRVTVEILLYLPDQEDSEEIINAHDFLKERDGILSVDTGLNPSYRNRGILTSITLGIPRDLPLDITNDRGDCIVSDLESDLWIDQNRGRLKCTAVRGNIRGEVKNSKLSSLEDLGSLVLKISDSLLEVSRARQVDLETESAILKIRDVPLHTRVRSSRGSLELINLQGEIRVESYATPMTLRGIKARLIEIRNRYADIEMESITARDLSITSAFNRLTLSFQNIQNQLYIQGKDCHIAIAYPPAVHPAYRLEVKYGRIHFKRKEPVDTRSSGIYSTLTNSLLRPPQMIIHNSYGDIILKNL